MSETNTPRISMNLDTNFLKLVAIAAMACDHVGKKLFPEVLILQVIGRIAFPIFAYCIVVGCLYTHDIKKYFLRLGLFALISQPFYVLLNYSSEFSIWDNISNWNIFFTLILGLAAVYFLQSRKWIPFAVVIFIVCWFNFDYGINGIVLMLLFYLCRKNRYLSLGLVTLFFLPPLFAPGQISLFGYSFDMQFFQILSLPLLYIPTHFNIKMNKYFFYLFYPAHLLLIWLAKLVFF
ncbi:TraX family protein [Anaerolentibacter hominis]|uniref:TraX family protein n=1 Tax=Anaerolentibacter hominis TaxID=3079009 RepID=UPI0031B822B5